jgi:hypothetical protein
VKTVTQNEGGCTMALRTFLRAIRIDFFPSWQGSQTDQTNTKIKAVIQLAQTDPIAATKEANAMILAAGRRLLAEQKKSFDETTAEGKKLVIKTGALHLNQLANLLLSRDAAFREEHKQFSEASMKKTSPMYPKRHYNTDAHDGHIATFRFVVPKGDYGIPKTVFEGGMFATIFSMQDFNDEGLNTTNIKQVTHSDPSKIGWTSGGISSSFCSLYPIRWGMQMYKEGGYIYCILPDEGYNVAEGIHHGTGYKTSPDKSNAEGMREFFSLTHLPVERIVAARKVELDGSIGPLLVNPKCNTKGLQANAEFKKFIEAKDVDELLALALLEGDLKLESTTKKAVRALQGKDKDLPKKIHREARFLKFGEMHHSLLESPGEVKLTVDNCDFLDIYAKHHENKFFRNNKKEFDDKKAESKAELLSRHHSSKK